MHHLNEVDLFSSLTFSCRLYRRRGIDIRTAGLSFLLFSLFIALLARLEWAARGQSATREASFMTELERIMKS